MLVSACSEPARSLVKPPLAVPARSDAGQLGSTEPSADASLLQDKMVLELPEPTKPDRATLGNVEGRVIDSRTGAGVPGIEVTVSGACQGDGGFGSTYTDQLGRYRIEMPKGDCVLEGRYGDATTGERKIRIEPRRTLTVDLKIDHRALAAALAKDPPENCPSSKRDEVVMGSVPTHADLDDIVRAVLDKNDIPDGRSKVVRAEIEHGRTVSRNALPEGYVLQTEAELEAEAKRTNSDVWYVAFYSVYATKSCAMVLVGGDFVQPRRQLKMCCCMANDFYEKRNGRWQFVKRTHQACA
jgi:hypothetical protein